MWNLSCRHPSFRTTKFRGTDEQNFGQLGRVNGQTRTRADVVVEQREMEFDTLKRPLLEATQVDLLANQLAIDAQI